MKLYYFNINSDKNGNHVIHSSDCKYLPIVKNRKMIGWYPDGEKAMQAASYTTYKSNFDGCNYCCSECNFTAKR